MPLNEIDKLGLEYLKSLLLKETLSQEDIQYLELKRQEELERVSPKLEAFRRPSRIKVAYGGRGAGAKSWSIASLLVQRAQYEKLSILCTREIQLSLEESVYKLVRETIERLRYRNWTITKEYIRSPTGSLFHFRGLKDMRAAAQIKGYEGADICWCEEAATISNDSWDALIPTIRKTGSEIWISYNPEDEIDPVAARFVKNPREDSIVIWLEPGPIDNPWWYQSTLPQEREEAYRFDSDLAEHIWGGQPRKQGQKAVMSRTAIRGAMDRNIGAEGAVEIGVDVARFGDDKTVMYKRHGLKIIDMKEFAGQDTMRTANEAWTMAKQDGEMAIKVDDTGVGGAVTDKLNELGANVIPINFGGEPHETIMDEKTGQQKKGKDLYTSVADEMWFEFPVNEADIPNDPILMQELAGRQYDYDTKGRRKIESKKDFKKRIGRSPDRADAILLCFYKAERYNILQFSGISADDLGV